MYFNIGVLLQAVSRVEDKKFLKIRIMSFLLCVPVHVKVHVKHILDM